jgi:dual-specificity kinase
MEHTYDSVGQKKEVIVIDDSQTPDQPPRKRTRAQVAAENAAVAAGTRGNGQGYATNGHANGGPATNSVASTSSAGKKRKVDEGDAAKKKGKPAVSSFLRTSEDEAHDQPDPYQKVTKGPQVQPVPANQVNTWDDAEGHYIVRPDDIIGHKCMSPSLLIECADDVDKIVRLLGQGTFGKVVEARNVENRRKVAIKVIRAVQKYRDASKIEIRVLETLRRNDPTNSK